MEEWQSHCPCLPSTKPTAKGAGLEESAGNKNVVELDCSLMLWNGLQGAEWVGALARMSTTAWNVVMLVLWHHIVSPGSSFKQWVKANTMSSGEFSWGGTSIKEFHRCPKVSSMRTEISCRTKGKGWLDFDFHPKCKPKNGSLLILSSKWVVSGTTGLWQSSGHSSIVFWSSDVGSSCLCIAEVSKPRVTHPPKKNVSWVQALKRQISFCPADELVFAISIQLSTKGTVDFCSWKWSWLSSQCWEAVINKIVTERF